MIKRFFASILLGAVALLALVACGGNGDDESLYGQLTLEEMGNIIEASGTFWEDWWYGRDRFDWGNWSHDGAVPEHLVSRGFARLLPASGLENISQVENYLLQYYTASFTHQQLFGEYTVFVEHDGALYSMDSRMGSIRPDWSTSTHVLIEQSGSHAVVETTVIVDAWHRVPYGENSPREEIYRFTFIDGRINEVTMQGNPVLPHHTRPFQ